MGTIQAREFTTRNGRRVAVRSAVEADAAGLLALYDDVRRTADETTVTTAAEADGTVEKTRQEIAEVTAHPARLSIVCVDGNDVIGELDLRGFKLRRMAHRARIGLSVRSDWREQWIGRELIRSALDWAREHPEIERVELGVFAHNHRAIAVYTKMGFVKASRRAKEFKIAPGVYWDDIQMEIWVKPPGDVKS